MKAYRMKAYFYNLKKWVFLMVKIIIADDHAVVRTGLQLILQGNRTFILANEAKNGAELLEKLQADSYDIAIIDMNMPGKDSLDLVLEVQQKHPNLKLMIFTMNTDEQLAKRLLKKGVLAYINKEENSEELLNALKSVSEGKVYLTPSQKNIFASQFITDKIIEKPHEKLTDREYQIMCLLASGISKTEIAEKLSISKNTLSNHRNNILKKLALTNAAELTKYALKHQLIY
jgi:DNA-binding NarL/FixJ family response regulator